MKIKKLLFDRVILRPDATPEITEGGVILPVGITLPKTIGTVLFAGDGTTQNGIFVPTTVKAGDRVLYNEQASTNIEVDGEELKIMPEMSIHSIIED